LDSSDSRPGNLTTLYNFCSRLKGSYCLDGANPRAGLIADNSGALYGTTWVGGAYDGGTVFKLTPPARGLSQWTLTTLHNFTGGADGEWPVAGLIFDNGALYGTTYQGGQPGCGGGGCGTVFKLDPATLILTTLYAFTGGADAGNPTAELVIGQGGLLYGTGAGTIDQQEYCHDYSCGTVFEIDPTSGVLTTLFTFAEDTNCYCYPYGKIPFAGLVVDSAGNLYGTTVEGGCCGQEYGSGVVFELSPPPQGQTQWIESVLWNFCSRQSCADGGGPLGGMVFDRSGLLYGTTAVGGTGGGGAVFELDPTTGMLITLESFPQFTANCPQCRTYWPNGYGPAAGLAIDYLPGGAFVLYGTTEWGGGSTSTGCSVDGQGSDYDSCGTVFELAR
jgi:uncharacterized repeat protein (TIGR03803 family)